MQEVEGAGAAAVAGAVAAPPAAETTVMVEGGQGGGGEHWQHPNEIEGVFNQYFENKDLFEMIHNPNKLLEDKVWEYYGNKGDTYCYGLMNRMYHFFDYINEISIDKEILDLFANLYNTDDSRIYLNKNNFDEFKKKYSSIKSKRKNIPIQLESPLVLSTPESIGNYFTDSQRQAKEEENRAQILSAQLLPTQFAPAPLASPAAAPASSALPGFGPPPGFGSPPVVPRPPGSGSIGPDQTLPPPFKLPPLVPVAGAAVAGPPRRGGTRRQNLRYRKTRKNRKD